MSACRRRLYGGIVLGCVLLLLLGGCAGSGEDLDEQGNPISDTTPPPEEPPPEEPLPEEPPPTDDAPTFTSIQETIFVPFCVCHVGAQAPLGLVLNSAATWDLLVNMPSERVSNLFLVEPGNPDDSYLIRKLEGGPGIAGFQMPPTELGEQHLPQELIDLVRAWIAAGALDN